MRQRLLAALVCSALFAGIAPRVRAQSLADVAKKEEERRKTLPQPAKVYTNKDLKPVPAPSSPASGAAAVPAEAADAKTAEAKAADKDAPAADLDTAKKGAGSDKDKTPVKDRAYWAGRLKELQDTLDRDRNYADAMQSRINALTADFVNRDDPAQRAVVERDRLKSLAELNRLKLAIQTDQKALADFAEEARRAGVPPRLAPVSTRSHSSVDPPILLVEDKDSLRAMLRHALEAQGHSVVEARDQPEAEAALLASRPAVVLSDLRLPEGDGFGVLRASKEMDPQLPVIVMTAFGSIQDAVAAMKEGALDFLAKPVDPDHLLLMVERALSQRRLATENMILKEELAHRRGAPQIVGDDPKLKQVSVALHRAAATDTTVLLEGESGTGKELFARALHALSPRADGPFIAINCAAIPENLLETELFGHEKGAFTGASARKPGKFELAHRGTLFLDEIGDLPFSLQSKILRALEEKRFERVGGNTSLQVDVRVVAATNRNLKAAVAARQYREDLYFRLSVFPITIPPLRDRPTDITTLALYFIDRFCRDLNKKPLTLSPAAEQELLAYAWPGNVRELQNCIERAAILTEGDTIHPRHLNLSFRVPVAPATGEEDASPWSKVDLSGSLSDVSRRAIAEVERRKIEQTLKEAAGNRGRTAELLQISYKALLAKLKDYGLDTVV